MIADILVKVAGFEREDLHEYYPRPSLAGPERCIRQMVYWASGAPRDREMGDRFRMTIDDSSWHEYLSADWIRKSPYQLSSEQMEVMTAVGKGHIDGVLTDVLLQDYHYEHKALNHFSFVRYWSGDDYPLDYITQTCLYNDGLRLHNPEITTSVLLIKNKNTAQYIDYKIFYDAEKDAANILEVCHSNGEKKIGTPLYVMENVIKGACNKFDAVAYHVDQQTIPDRQYNLGDWRCDFCLWSLTCWKDYEKDYAKLSEDAKIEGDVADLCRLYLQVAITEKEAAAHKEELRNKVIRLLQEQGVKKGKTGQGNPGDYVVTYTLTSQRRVKKTDDIPPELVPMITADMPMEKLSIRLIKEKERKKT